MRIGFGVTLLGTMLAFAPQDMSGAQPELDVRPDDGRRVAEPNSVETAIDESYRAHAASQISNVVNAIKLYETQYAVLPLGNARDEKAISTGNELVDILTGKDRDHNPKETVFIEGKPARAPGIGQPPHSGFVTDGNGSQRIVDPWGNEYAVVLDWDDSNEVDVPGFDAPMRANVVCWSYGKPKNLQDPKSATKNAPEEWITSWEAPAQQKKKRPGAGNLRAGRVDAAAQVKSDFAILMTALNVYRLNAGTYPSTAQGLDALVRKPTAGRIPKRWEPALKAEPRDPWGNPYEYRYTPGESEGFPSISTFGADRIDGTDDDLSN